MIDDHNIQDTRIRQLNPVDIRLEADYVLYWMQQSQRAEVNHALELGQNAAMIVCDRGYLKHQRKWKDRVARKAPCRVVQVESDVIVPVETVSSKAEYAAMQEMKYTGFMHNYMRMYWGKKILEWSSSPERAFRNTLAINNKYFLDGRDPNSYAGVAWIYGVHDRAWPQRAIYGKVRCMTASGLERKCDIHAYVNKVKGNIEKSKSF